MYRLFGTRGSGAAMVEMALAEAGAPYEFVSTGPVSGAVTSVNSGRYGLLRCWLTRTTISPR